MSKSAVDGFIKEGRNLINYYGKEWNMTYAELIGALRVLSREVEDEMLAPDEDGLMLEEKEDNG